MIGLSICRGPSGHLLALLGLLVLLAPPAHGSPDWRYQTEVLGGWRHLQEREGGATLVREEGFSTGFDAAVDRSMGAWLVRMNGAFERAALDYDGSTQGGAPLATRTDWSSQRLGVTVGRPLNWPAGAELQARLEYQRRARDIASTPTVTGLTENYRTLWLGLGISMRPVRPLKIELGFACAIESKADVDFASALDDASVGVDDHCRVGLSAPFDVGRWRKSTIYLRPYVAWERYPQSADAPLTSGGSPIGRVHLPNTDFMAFGVSIGLGGTFQ